MIATYDVFLINETVEEQTFWCFLAPPIEMASNPSVFAVSNLHLTIESRHPGANAFVIPASFAIGAGACNGPIGSGGEIRSSIVRTATAGETWTVRYADAPPYKAPSMEPGGPAGSADQITIVTEAFDKASNEAKGWFSRQSSGIKTTGGFVGTVWSPDPSTTVSLTPGWTFYISTGAFGEYHAVPWQEIPPGAAEVKASDFRSGAVTVTFTRAGDWQVRPGDIDATAPPPAASDGT